MFYVNKQSKTGLVLILICALMLPTSAFANEEDDGNKSYGNSTRDAVLIYAAAGAVTVATVLGLSTIYKRIKLKQHLDKYKKIYGNFAKYNDETMLFYAHDKQEVRLLISEGYDVNAQNNSGFSPIFSVQEPEAVKELIKNGADVNMRGHDGSTPLFHAYNEDKARALVKAGADIHTHNDDGDDVISFLQKTHGYLIDKTNDRSRPDIMDIIVIQGRIKKTIDYLSSLSR